MQKTRVWDLPTRCFHWLLVLGIIFMVVTAKLGGNYMQWHFWCGYWVLALLLFRVVWGIIGSRYARFSNFVPSPSKFFNYLKTGVSHSLGHNPMGALSVLAMLAALLFQAVSGLFSNDDIANEGPLVRLISKELSDKFTSLHHLNVKIIIALIALHIAAILFYLFKKRRNLIKPMITGDDLSEGLPAAKDNAATRLAALLVFAGCFAAVVYIVKYL